MRVACLVGEFPVLSETFVLNQITGLIDRGHEVDIYANQPGDTLKIHPDVEKYNLLERTYFIRRPLDRSECALKALRLLLTHFHRAPLRFLDTLNVFAHGSQVTSFGLLYSLVALLDKKPYDIIHCQFGTLGFRGMSFHALNGKQGKLVVAFRGHDISKYLQEVGDRVYDQLFQVGDLFMPNCDYFKQRLIKLGCEEQKISVYRSGIDCSRFRFAPRHWPADGRVRIVTSGRLVEKKGIEYGIRAVAQLIQTNRDVEYIVVGDGPLKPELQQLIDQLEVSHAVKLVGRKQQQELIEILDSAHIFIAPCVTSRDGNQDAPVNVLKEAMAMGLPVIGTWHGGIPELIEDSISGFLVPERDSETLAARLNELIEHPEQWPDRGRAGRAYVEQHYDLYRLNDQLVDQYQKLMSV
ncbi:glycosyltransferase [Leptolyngbya sp. FACHB-261]|uniref:glycosyltransferase n=1 Tax=Leptolyngbya sp. FACHB-261 TaxID=2692806 RepID=UPI0016862911|nr:glycosyltransferase [Leptolyngbya sp. FACHB-261]MBD2103234.1 glycosyltransferase [Leptolyngbya sp. FACHB-261]